MRKIAMVIIPLGIAMLCLIPVNLQAQWTDIGADICTHTSGVGGYVIASDGEGGAFFAWIDVRSFPYPIYVQRVDAYGRPLFAVNGTAITSSPAYPQSLAIVSDGAGGAFIAWHDYRNSNYDIFMQRIDSDGNPLWTANGITIIALAGDQTSLDMVQDGGGGAIIVWDDARTGSPGIYAQRVAADSTSMWTAGGVEVVSAGFASVDHPDVATDGTGGAVVVWEAWSGMMDNDLYCQCINPDGTIRWTWLTGGQLICNDPSDPSSPEIVSAGRGGGIIIWADGRNGSLDIWGTFIDGNATVYWTANGEAISLGAGNQQWPVVIADEEAGAIICWEDYRNGGGDIYAQRISSYGTKYWAMNGTPICTADGQQTRPAIINDGDGGALIAWQDYRIWSNEVYAQRIDDSGSALWAADGAKVCASLPIVDAGLALATDGAGGGIVAWKEIRTGSSYQLYANRVEANGYWGYPAPGITGVADVSADQGGQITVDWGASRLDAFPDLAITSYSIWRSISPAEAASMETAGKKIVDVRKTGELPVSSEARVILDGEGYAWEWLSDQPSLTQEQYSYTAATLWDSTGLGNGKSHFMVAAHTSTPSVFWFSAADSGYSVDNLAPGVPLGLAGEQSYTPEGLGLSWDPNVESDLFGYRIYRDIDASFEPGPGNFVASTTDTFSFDGDWSWDSGYAYKVTAVDVHGNESLWALFMSSEVTGDDPMPLPDATFLEQNYPNPFNPNTTIAFGLKSGGFVNLSIYDAAGRLVAVLINESRTVGPYTAVWTGKAENGSPAASGVYFYRLSAGDFLETRKMILLR